MGEHQPVDRRHHVARAVEARVGLFAEEARHQRLERRRERAAGNARRERRRRRRGHEPRELGAIGRVEGAVPGEHLVEHHPERVEIRARVDVAAEGLLGRHVLGRPVGHAHLRQRRAAWAASCIVRFGDLGDPEVEHLGHLGPGGAVAHQHHVLGLEIAVHDPDRVHGVEPERDLPRDAERAIRREGSALDHRAEDLAFEVVEHQEARAVVEPPHVVRGGDVGVDDAPQRHGLALEARHRLGVAEHLGVEHLDRHAAPRGDVLGAVDRAHAASAHELVDAVAPRDHLAEEAPRIAERAPELSRFIHTRGNPTGRGAAYHARSRAIATA